MFNLFDNDTALNDFNFILSQRGEDVDINSSTNVKALITNTNLEQVYDDKKITTLHAINRGDIVQYNNKTYMILSEVSEKRYTKYKAIMRQLPHTIIINQNCNFSVLDCYITNSNLKIDAGSVMSLASGNIQVHISKQQITTIPLGSRFFVGTQVFKIEGVDDFTREGIITLSCKSDQINYASDNIELGIANYTGCLINVNTPTINLHENQTYQINYTTSNNEVVEFISSDENIATVSHIGLITAIAEGKVTITIYNKTLSQIQAQITVNIDAEVINDDITIEVYNEDNDNEILNNDSVIYQATVKQGNTVLTDEDVTWNIYADNKTSSTTLATITNHNSTSCTIKAKSLGYVQLKCTLVSDNDVFVWQRIRIRGLI